jgi:hypothetical protein
MRPNSELFAEIDGTMKLRATDGELRQSIPLVAGIVHASEGMNPFGAGNAVTYETIDARFRFDQGRLHTKEFRLEGPLRIFLSGSFVIARPGNEIHAEVGVFLFRQVDRLLGGVPLIRRLIPGGSDKGLFGAYFEVGGVLGDPELSPLALKTLVKGLPVPDLVKAPFSAIHDLLSSKPEVREQARQEADAEARQ